MSRGLKLWAAGPDHSNLIHEQMNSISTCTIIRRAFDSCSDEPTMQLGYFTCRSCHSTLDTDMIHLKRNARNIHQGKLIGSDSDHVVSMTVKQKVTMMPARFVVALENHHARAG